MYYLSYALIYLGSILIYLASILIYLGSISIYLSSIRIYLSSILIYLDTILLSGGKKMVVVVFNPQSSCTADALQTTAGIGAPQLPWRLFAASPPGSRAIKSGAPVVTTQG